MKRNAFIVLLLLCSLFTFAQITNPHIKWKFKTEAPIRGAVLLHQGNLFFGNSSGSIYCLDKETGKEIWKFQAGGAITTTPALANGQLIVPGRDGKVYALNSTDGKLSWTHQMQSETPHTWGWDYYTSSPAVNGNRVLIGSGDNNMYALDAASGKPVWTFTTGDKIRATPLVQGEKVFVPSFDGFLYELNIQDGKMLRKFETEGVSYYGKIFGWDRTSIISKPALGNNMLVIGSRDGGLYGLDVNTFEKKWRFTYGSSWVGSSPVIDDGRVFVGWSDKLVFSAVDLETGKELWQHKCGAYVYSTPAVDRKDVYVGSFNGKVYSFEKSSGKVNWEYQTGGAVLSSPTLDNGILYIGSDNGFLYAFENGKPTFKAVYQPQIGGQKELSSDEAIAPFLEERGYQRLDTTSLAQFLRERIQDGNPSVVVFTHQYLPKVVSGERAAQSLLKEYMEAGGKIVWLEYFPNYWTTNSDLKIVGMNPDYAAELLDITFDVNMDFGTYFATATDLGKDWGLPENFSSPASAIANSSAVTPLATNELGRIAAFYKPFGKKPNAGFVSFCSWGLMPIAEQDLKAIQEIAEYGL